MGSGTYRLPDFTEIVARGPKRVSFHTTLSVMLSALGNVVPGRQTARNSRPSLWMGFPQFFCWLLTAKHSHVFLRLHCHAVPFSLGSPTNEYDGLQSWQQFEQIRHLPRFERMRLTPVFIPMSPAVNEHGAYEVPMQRYPVLQYCHSI